MDGHPVPTADPHDLGGWPAYTETWRCPSRRAWSWHRHVHHELLWDVVGELLVSTEDGHWRVPVGSGGGLWIPAGTPHEVRAGAGSGFACTFVLAATCADAGVETRTTTGFVEIRPVAAEALLQMGELEVTQEAVARLAGVVSDFVRPSGHGASLIRPSDPRARRVVDRLLLAPADSRSLEDWAREVHTSSRTLGRAFRQQTGHTFGAYRTLLRIGAAMPRLAAGEPVEVVAARVGFGSTSAFSAAFRRRTGTSPGLWARRQSGTPASGRRSTPAWSAPRASA